MRAAVLRAFGSPLVIEEVEDPRPGPDDAAIRVMACGIDGTDLKLLGGFGYTPDLPFVMGHEVAGVVAEVGERVADFAPGDRVIVYIFLVPPGSAGSEREQLHPALAGVIGVKGHHGGYAERLRVPAAQLVHLPAGIPWPEAAVHGDAGLTAWHAIGRARLAAGETALIVGVGGVGSFAVQFARLAGARVVAVERTPAKLAWARSLGADEAVTAEEAGRLARTLPRGGFDCALDIVGTAETFAAALGALAPGGRLVVVGYTPEALPLDGRRLAQNELEVIGTRAGSRRDLAAALALTAAGRIRPIVTATFPLTRVNEALDTLRRGEANGRLVLDPTAGGSGSVSSPGQRKKPVPDKSQGPFGHTRTAR
jgi:propanol-preferring alcohol dehydrogenase